MSRTLRRWVTMGVVLLAAGLAPAQEEPPPGPRIEPEADAVLKRMSAYLAGLKQFQFEADIVFDDVLETGQKLQLSNRLRTDVRRPDHMRAEADGDTAHKIFWYDGKTVALLETDKKLYSVVEVPPSIDAMLDYLIERYGLTVPIADVLYGDPYATLTEDVDSGGYVGLHRVGAYKCHHLAFTQDVIDWQLWVDDGEQPLPRKLLITYTDVPGQPQYSATFVKWDAKADFNAEHFAFKPPEGAEKIEMLPLINPEKAAEPKGGAPQSGTKAPPPTKDGEQEH